MDVSWIFWCFFWLFDEFFACSGASSTQPWAKCPVRRYVAPARNSSLQEIHLEVRLIKKNHTEIHQHRADFQQQKTSFLPLELPFWWENSWEIHQLLVRFYEEITQKGGPNRNHEATLGGYHRYPKEHLGTTMSPRKVISGIFRQIMDIQTCINMSQVI